MNVPKWIYIKAARAEEYAAKANCLVYEIEKWMEEHGVDDDTARDEYIYDDCGGVGHIINADALQQYLENM